MRRHDEDEEMRDRDKGDEYYDMQDRHRREHHSHHGGRGGGEEDDDQPPELEPEGWPARYLRTAYGSYLGDYQAGLRAFFRRHAMSDASVPRVEGHGPTMTP